MNTYIDYYESPHGIIRLTSDEKGLTSLWFADSKEDEVNPSSHTDDAKRWLDEYFEGREPSFTPSLSFSGTEFQNLVYEAISSIPFGETRTYKEIAEIVAEKRGLEKMSSRAVGHALSKNKILLIIPCHRVIGSNGNLTGFAGGIERKKQLLEFEQKKQF